MSITVTSSCRLILADWGSFRQDLVKVLKEVGVSIQEHSPDAAEFAKLGLSEMDVLVEIQGKNLGLAEYFPEIARLQNWKAFGCVHPEDNQPLLILTRKKTESPLDITDANEEIAAKLAQILFRSKAPQGQAMNAATALAVEVPPILLVDDEAMVRHIMRRAFQENGYFVLEAADGNDAFLLAQQFPYSIYLLVADLSMPKMNGRDLAGRVATVHPETRVLFFSGYLNGHLPSGLAPDPAMAFLQKPFTREVLLKKVSEVLNREK